MDDTNWQKQLLIGVVMLLVVGGLIGVVVAVAGLKVANLAGIGDTRQRTSSSSRLHIPRNVGSSTPAPPTQTPISSAPSSRATASKPPRRSISLTVSPTSVGTYERINLSGRYNAADGTALQVQRRENGVWGDFPTVTHVSGGSFDTYVETGHTGLNVFRVTDVAHARSSNMATVTVH